MVLYCSITYNGLTAGTIVMGGCVQMHNTKRKKNLNYRRINGNARSSEHMPHSMRARLFNNACRIPTRT